MRAFTFLIVLLGGVSLAYPDGNTHDFVQSAADNCTENSQSLSRWRIDTFVLKVYNWDTGGTTGSFGFRSSFSATNMTVDCMLQNGDLEKLKNSWSKCNNTETEFQFDLSDITLTVRETWTCPGSPG
jgi:hypothetical protein